MEKTKPKLRDIPHGRPNQPDFLASGNLAFVMWKSLSESPAAGGAGDMAIVSCDASGRTLDSAQLAYELNN
jgi:hypothetical protein